MSTAQPELSRMGFAKTFVLPCLLIFLLPIVGVCFFLHAQSRFDAQSRESILGSIRGDSKLTAENREKALKFFSTVRVSDLMTDPQFAQQVDASVRFDYATFRWMIRLSILSILASVAVFALVGLCVVLSLRSQQMQYLSLSIGWQVLRIYGAAQTVVQGILLIALSYWVTVLWFNMYVPKLILAAAILAVIGVFVVVVAIFKRVKLSLDVQGTLLDPERGRRFFAELSAISRKVGTPAPDQVIVGIDDNFFVTEAPVCVEGKTHKGRTLFVSLSLLKQLRRAEADGVLAHELAHFSGSDTFYSKKIGPLIERYQRYLVALSQGGVGLLVFPVMNCFRALYELSLQQRQRQREFRADRIAAEVTSPRDMAAALLRITAFSKFRHVVQQALFEQEQVLESANIAEKIGAGFPSFAMRFATQHDVGELTASHPFDSHPPLVNRLEAVGVSLSAETAESLLAAPEDGGWYGIIDNAEAIERQQWDNFEAEFRKVHEQSLAYRFLPETDEERAIVVKSFPEISFQGKAGTLTLDHERLQFTSWPAPIEFREIKQCSVDNGIIEIHYERGGNAKQTLKLKPFGKPQQLQAVLNAFNRYWGRYQSARAYQAQKRAEEAASAPSPA